MFAYWAFSCGTDWLWWLFVGVCVCVVLGVCLYSVIMLSLLFYADFVGLLDVCISVAIWC